MHDRQIRLTARGVTSALAATAALLVILSVAGQLHLYLTPWQSPWGIVGLFNVDFEMNVPTFFAVLVLLLASALLTAITLLTRQVRAPYAFHWGLLALGFFVIAADEFFALHEKISEPMRRLLGWETMGHLHFAWVIPGAIVVAVLAVGYCRFLIGLDRATRVRFIVAAAVYLSGVIGVELIGGRYAEAHGTWNLTYSMITTVEESLEMAGSILFVDALLRHLAESFGSVTLVFGREARPVATDGEA